MSEVPQADFAAVVNRCFEAEGLPRRIKIDNGHPLVYPKERDLPTLTVLWWIGLGIEVVYNKPACPQQNGTVEGLQGTICRWAEPQHCRSVEQLQEQISEALRIQRQVYRMPRHQHKTRAELYPDLLTNPRQFCPEQFDHSKVEAYLAQKVWYRQIKKNGCIKLYRTEIYVSQKLANTTVTVTYDPIEHKWLIRKPDATLLQTSTRVVPTEEDIRTFVNMSKNNSTQL
jgi:hypothetical protein